MLALLVACCAVAFAQSPRELITDGNAKFDAGDYAEALAAYDSVPETPDAPYAADLLHNRAAAHFKLGQYDDARDLWVRAAGMKDAPFEAAARYNLGNCNYAEALAAVEQQQAEPALELLDKAIDQYRDALRLDPNRQDARSNLELAGQLKKKIEEQAEQQPQSQPSSQPSQDQQQENDQQQQPCSQPSSQPSESDQDQSGNQQQDRQQDGKQQDQQDEQSEEQQSPQSQPTGQQPQPQAEEDEQTQDKQQIVPINMTPEEAERLLQRIRDEQRRRRAMLRAREAAKHKPVERDW